MKQSLRWAVTKSLAFLLASSALPLALSACGKAKSNPQIPTETIATTKPDGVSMSRVSLSAMADISHLERALKPYLGIANSAPGEDCVATKSTSTRAMWETNWACGMTSKAAGRKEVQGIERINFDRETSTLDYESKFVTRNFEDQEAAAKAHTLTSGRRIRIVFKTTDGTLRYAKVTMTSSGNTKNGPLKEGRGSEWTSKLNGNLSYVGSDWTLTSGSTLAFEGSLYGLDGERLTPYASGAFNYVSNSAIVLNGMTSGSDCTKPVGSWSFIATGAGTKIDTKLSTDIAGGDVSGGSSFAWPANLCSRP